MATLSQTFQYVISGLLGENANRPRHFGDKADTTSLTVNGQVFDTGNITIADNFGNAVLWQTSQGALTAPSFVMVLSSADLIVEIANTTPNPDERMLFRVAANALCIIPTSVMGGYASNTTRLDGAALVSGTDYNTITEVRVQRDVASGSGSATVRLVLLA